MFNSASNKLQRELDDAIQRNSELVAALEECCKEHTNNFVIKLIPSNADQFYIDGEFVVDENRAVYGSHQLSFSEAVCWKAGKEVAKRAYEQLIAESDARSNSFQNSRTFAEEQLKKANEYISIVENELSEARSQAAHHVSTIDNLNRNLEVLNNEISQLNTELEAAAKERDSYRTRYQECSEQLRKMTEWDSNDSITTPYGVVQRAINTADRQETEL